MIRRLAFRREARLAAAALRSYAGATIGMSDNPGHRTIASAVRSHVRGIGLTAGANARPQGKSSDPLRSGRRMNVDLAIIEPTLRWATCTLAISQSFTVPHRYLGFRSGVDPTPASRDGRHAVGLQPLNADCKTTARSVITHEQL